MKEYIDREAAIHAAKEAWAQGENPEQWVKNIDPAPVREVVPGHWMWDQGTRTCNQCGQMRATDKRDNFCPNCGADMKVTEEE